MRVAAAAAAALVVLLSLAAWRASAQDVDPKMMWPWCTWTILDQQKCGSCYAFASTGVLTDRLCISYGSSSGSSALLVSPQGALDYMNDAGDSPCNGGYAAQVLVGMTLQMEANGVPTCTGACATGCAPYIAGPCEEYVCTGGSTYFNTYASDMSRCGGDVLRATLAEVAVVTPTAGAIQAEIQQNGPVTAQMSLCQSFFHWYQNGANTVYTTPCSPNSPDYVGGHVVKIVGWTEDSNSPTGFSWTIANSWGVSWGDGGYFSLPVGAYPSACGIEDNAYTVLMNGQQPAWGTTMYGAGDAPTEAAAQRDVQGAQRAGGVHHHDATSPAHAPAVAFFMANLVGPDSQLAGVHAYATQPVAGVHEQLTLRTVDASGAQHVHTVRLFFSLFGTRTVTFWSAVPVTPALGGDAIAGIVIGCAVGVTVAAVAGVAVARRRRRAAAAARGAEPTGTEQLLAARV